jgi:hypothetical protein
MVSPSVLCLASNVLQGIATFLRAAIDRASADEPATRPSLSAYVGPLFRTRVWHYALLAGLAVNTMEPCQLWLRGTFGAFAKTYLKRPVLLGPIPRER